MADPKKIYWDSCVWIGLINDEADKAPVCRYLIEEAKRGEVEIWTSSLTLAEVFKRKCGASNVSIASHNDADFEAYIQQDFLVEVMVDHDIGVTARRLLRTHPVLKKPMDAIHLATALFNNVDELHTFDADNLLDLNGKVIRSDGNPLVIIKPELPAGYQASLLPTPLE